VVVVVEVKLIFIQTNNNTQTGKILNTMMFKSFSLSLSLSVVKSLRLINHQTREREREESTRARTSETLQVEEKPRKIRNEREEIRRETVDTNILLSFLWNLEKKTSKKEKKSVVCFPIRALLRLLKLRVKLY